MRKIELLVPASSLEVLKIAVIFGADAVYIGGEAFGLRAKAKNFSHEDMKEGIAFAHEHGVKVYVTVNILAHNYDLPGVREYLTELKELKPDEYEVKLGDKAGDGTQLRPFIVWFGEAVPEIETAVNYVEKADIFVIIGTSMNVYPAAGLLNYVPREAEVYLIDPKPVDVHSTRRIHIIQKGASEGVQELRSLLKP